MSTRPSKTRALLRLIFLVDDPILACQVLQELQRGAQEVDWEPVYDGDSIREAVTERGPWDLAILDGGKAGFTIRHALEAIAGCNVHLPCVAIRFVPAPVKPPYFFEVHAIEELMSTVEMALDIGRADPGAHHT